MGSLKSHRLKRGLSKLQPKWKNPQAAKSFYMNTFGMIFMFSSFAAPFWTIKDISEPGVDFKLGLFEGAYACANHVLDEKAMWPDDLCCTDLKTDTEKKTMADLEAIKPTKRTDEDKDKLNELRDIMPECEPMCKEISYDGVAENMIMLCGFGPNRGTTRWEYNELPDKDNKDGCKLVSIKPCKYYQAPGSMARMVAGLAWYAGATGLVCSLYSLKAATKPSKSDVKLTKIFGAFGFLGFLLGLLAVAFFTPGTRGDSADIDGGFFLQVIGLCGVLGGVITILDAGSQDLVTPALNFQATFEPTKISPA